MKHLPAILAAALLAALLPASGGLNPPTTQAWQ